MCKKIFITITIIILIGISAFSVLKLINTKKIDNNNQNQMIKDYNHWNLANKGYVTDDCMNEWKDYAKAIEEELKQASNISEDKDTRYKIINENDYISIYKIEENGNEMLYKKTNINTRYLTDDDILILNQGIEIKGREELNKLLEDFE